VAVIPTVSVGADVLESWGDAVAAALTAYGCVLLRTANMTISDVTDTAVTFPSGSVTEVLDTNSFHDTGSNTDRITIPSGGDAWYDIGGAVEWDANSTGHRQVWLTVNGTEVPGSRITMAGFATVNPRQATPTLPYLLAATDIVRLNVRQSSTANRTLQANGVRFWCVRRWPA